MGIPVFDTSVNPSEAIAAGARATYEAEIDPRVDLTWDEVSDVFRQQKVGAFVAGLAAYDAQRWMPLDKHYSISVDGQIRKADGTPVRQFLNDQGYSLARLGFPRRIERVHRLVAQAFLPQIEGKTCVNHIDNNRSNYRVENLEWCTQAENLEHARSQNRMYKHPKGKRSANASLSDDQVRQIRSMYEAGVKQAQISRAVGVTRHVVGHVISGETYAHVSDPLPAAPQPQTGGV